MKAIISPLIILFLLSSFLSFYQFNQIPKNLAFDEVEFTKLALSLDGKPYTPYSPQATGHPTLYFYILLFSFKIFGVNNFALRFPSALFGLINVILFYLIMKKVFQQSSNGTMEQFFPFLLSLIFLTSHWYLNFTRFAFEATFLLFLELTSIYFLFKYFDVILSPPKTGEGSPTNVGFSHTREIPRYARNDKLINLLLSGLFAGLAFNSYTPGRIFFILPLVFVILNSIQNPRSRNKFGMTVKALFLFLIPFLLTILPLYTYFLTHKDIRIEQQFFLKNSQLIFNQKINYLWQNIKSTALMFHFKGDINGRHNYPGKPVLNPILGILFIIGLIISIRNWKNPINLFAISYLLLAIFPTLLTYPWENPNMLRTFTAIPSVVYFIGVVINNLNAAASKLSLLPRKKIAGSLIFLILISSIYEIRTYFKYQSQVFPKAFEVKTSLDKLYKEKKL